MRCRSDHMKSPRGCSARLFHKSPRGAGCRNRDDARVIGPRAGTSRLFRKSGLEERQTTPARELVGEGYLAKRDLPGNRLVIHAGRIWGGARGVASRRRVYGECLKETDLCRPVPCPERVFAEPSAFIVTNAVTSLPTRLFDGTPVLRSSPRSQLPDTPSDRPISARFPARVTVVFGGSPMPLLSHHERPNARRTRDGRPDRFETRGRPPGKSLRTKE